MLGKREEQGSKGGTRGQREREGTAMTRQSEPENDDEKQRGGR